MSYVVLCIVYIIYAYIQDYRKFAVAVSKSPHQTASKLPHLPPANCHRTSGSLEEVSLKLPRRLCAALPPKNCNKSWECIHFVFPNVYIPTIYTNRFSSDSLKIYFLKICRFRQNMICQIRQILPNVNFLPIIQDSA